MEMNTKRSHEFEEGGAYVDDDDVFFAEIRRQILVLTGDNEDFPDTKSSGNNSFIGVAKRSYPAAHFDPFASSLGNISWWENKNSTYSVPASLAKLWENNNGIGTGVFIPQATVKCRRDYRPRRMNNDKRRVYKRVENKHS